MVFRNKDNPENGCALERTQYIDSSEILGVTCRRYRRTWQEPDGQSATEDIWMAPAIGCEIVQSRCEWSRGGTLTSTFERIPKEISIGPPDDSLFTIPAHYEEVPPSRQMDLLEAASISLLRGNRPGRRASFRHMTLRAEGDATRSTSSHNSTSQANHSAWVFSETLHFSWQGRHANHAPPFHLGAPSMFDSLIKGECPIGRA
jgi:hypothetical protein